MLNVALTGNIAAGKSTVVELFRRWGATVIDADVLVREAQQPGTQVLTAIVRKFGADVLARDGTLDRAALRGKVMGDDTALSDLNAIVHPAVRLRREQLMREARARGDALVINDIPLLFEAMDPAGFDCIVLVDAPAEVRRARLLDRRLSAEDADRMIRAQMPASRKRSRSGFVIENAGTPAELAHAAGRVFDELRRRAAPAEALAWPAAVIVATGPRDAADVVRALTKRCADAGISVRRATRATLARVLQGRPSASGEGGGGAPALIATERARPAAATAWEAAGRPGPFHWIGPDQGDAPVPLDLRPWGGPRVRISG